MSDRQRGTKLRLAQDVELQTSVPGIFLQRALERGLSELRMDGWATAETSLASLGEPALRLSGDRFESALYERDGVLLHVGLWGNHVSAVAAAGAGPPLDETFDFLRERLRPPDPSSAHEVTVTFWTYSPHGPQPSWRSIGVPEWGEIHENYSTPTRAGLEAIMRDFEPAHGGQLILWHGLAGTGKTFALRALAWEWRDWCEFHYIVDPDSFFGQHADYLMSVLMQEGAPIVGVRRMVSHGMGWSTAMIAEDGDGDESEERAWRVLVLEDTGELLTSDARAVIGQGLSRFLNVVDGLIGQGLRVLVLVTTNEEIKTLHPAVARPGRCAANIQFVPLAPAEAAEWLSRRGIDEPTDGAASLASLYARLEGRSPEAVTLADFGG